MRRTLLVVAVVALAGCLGGGPAASPDATPTTDTDAPTPSTSPDEASPGSSSTPALGTCGSPRTTDDGNAKLTPRAFPDRPATLSNETAGAYVSAFEEAYAWNGALSDDIQSATVSIFVANTTAVADGYVVTLDVQLGYTENVTVDEGTPIQQAADDWYTAAYFVNESILRRSVARSASASLDPRNGTVLRCATG